MNNSLWFVKHKNILRWMILILLAISMMGPWSFDLINTPAEYACSAPIVRLYGDFCGVPLSGVQVFGLFIGGFFYMLLEMVKGTFAGQFRELFVGLLILPLFPFFTTLLSIWKKRNASTTNDQSGRVDTGFSPHSDIVHLPDKPPGDSVVGTLALYYYGD